MADRATMMRALRNADAAGDTEAAQRIAAMIRQADAPARPWLQRVQEGIAAPTRMLKQGATFGFSDEMAGAAAAAVEAGEQAFTDKDFDLEGIKAAYMRGAEKERAEIEGFRERNPATALALEILGGLGVAAAAGGPKLPPKVPPFARSIATGAGYGAAYGAGTADGGAEDRLTGAARGAALGGATAGVVYPVTKAIGSGVGALSRALANKGASKRASMSVAQRQLADALARDDRTAGQLSGRLREMGPQATIADAGGANVRGLARAAAQVPGPAKNRAQAVYGARQEAEGERIRQRIAQYLNPKDYYSASSEYLTRLSERAKVAYADAYKSGLRLQSKRLDSLLSRNTAKQAMREAAGLAEIEGRHVSRIDPAMTQAARDAASAGKMAPVKGGVGRGITTEAVDDLKRGIDVMIERETNPLTGRLNKRGAALANYKRDILNEVDRLNPKYKIARQKYGDDAELVKALREGRKALRKDPEQIAMDLHNLSDAGKRAYRSGAARAIMDKVDSVPDGGSAARTLAGKEVLRKKLRAILPEKYWDDFYRMMKTEQSFAATRNTVVGGSPTAPRLAEQADMEKAGSLIEQAASGRGGLISAGLRAALDALKRPNANVGNELSKILISRNQAANQKVAQDLAAAAERAGVSAAKVAEIRRIADAMIGQRAGAAYSQ